MPDMTTGAVVSDDGTTIGYRRVGDGPPLVVVHGMMSSGFNHIDLAHALASQFTVFLPDRRGRGRSGPYNRSSVLAQDVADLRAMVHAGGAERLLGVSIGGVIALEAALQPLPVRLLAVYEPPFFVAGPAPRDWLVRFDYEMARGRVASAMVTGMKASKLGPPMVNHIPRFLLEPMTRAMLSREARGRPDDYVSMQALAPTMHHDGRLLIEANDNLSRFAALEVPVLLLGGTKGPPYMKAALDSLERILPHPTRVTLQGLDHAATWNEDMRGHPAAVASALGDFFA